MKKVTAKKKGLQAFVAISVKEMSNVKGGSLTLGPAGFNWTSNSTCYYCNP
ncbi:MAG: hypothetical protein AB8B56_04870 [Crocinitomicaceae bacterium]